VVDSLLIETFEENLLGTDTREERKEREKRTRQTIGFEAKAEKPL
jgi:hypothetical protein